MKKIQGSEKDRDYDDHLTKRLYRIASEKFASHFESSLKVGDDKNDIPVKHILLFISHLA